MKKFIVGILYFKASITEPYYAEILYTESTADIFKKNQEALFFKTKEEAVNCGYSWYCTLTTPM